MLVACAAFAAAASVASCAVDSYLTCGQACVEGGADVVGTDGPSADGGDASTFDGFPDAPVCPAPDCFDGGLPDGWTPIDFASGAEVAACPQDFAATDLVYDAGLASGACNCTACAASGSWSCQFHVGAHGASCNQTDYDASASGCFTPGGGGGGNTGSSAEVYPPTRSGSPSCGTSTPNGTGKAASSPARMCTPTQCNDLVCGQASFDACIYAAGDVGCPAGFSKKTLAGTAATATCNACPSCAVANADAGCAASITLYDKPSCGGTAVQVLTPQNGCTLGLPSWQSFALDASTPTPTCSYGGGSVAGTAQLANAITVCCP